MSVELERAHPATCACCRPDARRALRRPLTYAERHIDVELLTAALDAAKARLHALIVAEQRAAARRVNVNEPRPRMIVTPAMLDVLRQLFELGRRAAILEARSMGVPLALPQRSYAQRPHIRGSIPDGTQRGATTLAAHLARFGDRLRFEALRTVGTTQAGFPRGGEISAQLDARAIMSRAIVQTPGALDAAGRVVSMTLASGLADVFSANADAFDGWQYTAVLDGATCPTCETMDGTEYATWAEAMTDLPDGGPNPDCDGETRCRCRLVPIPAGGDQTPSGIEPAPVEPPPEVVAPEPPPGSFAGAAYDAAVGQDAIDSLGVIGLPSSSRTGGFVLEHAVADHEAVMATGRELHAEVTRRVEALAPRVSGTDPLIVARAKAEVMRHGLDLDTIVEKLAKTQDRNLKTLLAGNVRDAERRLAKAQAALVKAETTEVHYVRIEDVRRVERAVLEERGVTFATRDDLAVRVPTMQPGHATYAESGARADVNLKLAGEHYPKAWIDASNQLDTPSLKIVRNARNEDGTTAYRSHYQPGRGIIAISERGEADMTVFVHELAHRLEEAVPELVRAERAFYEYRARGGSFSLGTREAAQDLYPEATAAGARPELSIFDGWTTPYMGKAYPGMTAQSAARALEPGVGDGIVHHGAYEILSQAMGEAFGAGDGGLLVNRATMRPSLGSSTIRTDRELMQWLYGVLTHLRPAA